MPRLALLLVALALAACGLRADAEQARVCRLALPALNEAGARITVLRALPGPNAGAVRLDYAAEGSGGGRRERWALCRFAASGLDPAKTELVGVETENGPVAGSTLYLLKRFYIESPEGVVGDPGPGDPGANLPAVSAPAAYALQQILVGLPRTAIYALIASAYALVFGLVGRINLAFGELAAVGSAATVAGVAIALALGATTPLAGLALGLFLSIAASALHGAVVGSHFAVARVGGASGQASLIATVGLSLALTEYLRLAQSPVTVWLPPIWSDALPLARSGSFVASVTPVSLLTAAVGASAALALVVLMRFSAFGRAWRAYADDALAASLVGIDGARLLLATLALSGALAGLAGTLVVIQFGGLGFAGGFALGLKALIAAVLGGIGSVGGALLGGFAIGVFETLWSAAMPIAARDVALYAALVAVLIFRPGGFFGMKDPSPRQV
jgi:branched-chain amino acid transport system permease protein